MPNYDVSFQRVWSVSSSFDYSVSFPEGTSFSAFSGETLVVTIILTMDYSPDDYTPDPFIFTLPNMADEIEEYTLNPTSFIPTDTGTAFTVSFKIGDTAGYQKTITQDWKITNSRGTHEKTGNIEIEIVPSFQARKEDGALIPIIHNGDVMRILTGSTGKIDSQPVEGMWLGYINRKFYNDGFKPTPKFYFEPTTIKQPGAFGDEFSFKSEHTGGTVYTTQTRYYRLCFVYDGNQRGLMGKSVVKKVYQGTVDDPDTTSDETVNKYGKLSWKIDDVNTLSKRITEIECYRSDRNDGGWERIANIPIADTKYNKPSGEAGITTSTTFSGHVKYDKVCSTDPKITDSFNGSLSSHPVINDILGGDEQSQFIIKLGDTSVRNLNAHRRRGTGGSFDGWDSEFQVSVTLAKCNGTTQTNDLISAINWVDEDDNTLTYDQLYNADKPLFDWALKKKNITLFDDELDFQSKYYYWYGGGWQNRCGCHSEYIQNCFGGENVIFLTTSTGGVNNLVGKGIKVGDDARTIIGNNGNFIQVDSAFPESALDGSGNPVNQTFTVMEDTLNITYTLSNSDKTMEIGWNDMGHTGLGSHPLDTAVSIDVNGDYAKLVNGRLFQGNITLDPFGAEEKHTDWVAYSELGQPDVSPVSNVIRFVDREGGSITGLAKIMDRLVVCKEQAMYMINCPPNVDPSNWSQVESIHNIGNIAPRGLISSGDQLFTIFYDGIYRMTANNLADSDKTPTERLKITDSIQDIYDAVNDKTQISTTYDQYQNEVIFSWIRSSKNLVKNGSFHSQKYWDFESLAELDSLEAYSTNGKHSAKAIADNSGNNPSSGSYKSDYISISDSKHYCISVYAKTKMTTGRFYCSFDFYNKQKERVGGYPRIVVFSTDNQNFARYYKNLRPHNDSIFDTRENPAQEFKMPKGAKYLTCRAYFWSNHTLNEDFPLGFGYTDDWMLEETSTSVNTPSTYETQESKQEMWAYSLVDGSWRQIDVESGMGLLTVDEKGSVLGYDESGHKIRAFAEPEAVVGKITSHPVVINEKRTDVVRKIKAKFKSSDDLTVKITPDGNSTKTQTRTLTGTGNVKSEQKRVKSRCQTFEIEITTPDTTNEMEIHNYTVDYK